MGSRFDDWKKGPATSGFMVAVKGAGAPDFVHDTQEAAVKEAKRLLDGLPDNKDQTAFILRLTGTVFRGKATRPAPEVATFPDELSAKFTTPAPGSSAPKFKPGDRVYYDSKLAPKGRVYGTVVPAEQWPLFGKGALPDHDPVFALWGTSPEVGWMPADRVFPDLRTIAGGGVLTLQAGRKGKTRDGKIVGPLGSNGRLGHPWGDGSAGRYTGSGFFFGPSHTDDRDIVELLPEGA